MAVRDSKASQEIDAIRLIERLGRGSMGVVYRAWHRDLKQEVAIKILHERQEGTKRRRSQARFLREADVASGVLHPNVVRIYGSGSWKGQHYLVMELVIGASLGDVLEKNGAIDFEQVQRIGAMIASGLAAIHAAGVIHRDIKPDNVLLGPNGIVKITDLGLARNAHDEDANRLTATGVVVGTPLYVAPEAIMNTRSAGAPADVYSLGATLYHLLSGEPPFNGDSPYEILRMHIEKPPPALSERIPGIPLSLEQIVMACMAKDPKERPTAERVSALLAGRPLSVGRENRRIAILAILSFLIVAGLAVLIWVLLGVGASRRSALINLPPADQWEVQIDDGPTKTVVESIEVNPGNHRLRLQRYDPEGRLLTWTGSIQAKSGEKTLLEAQATLKPSSASIAEIPGIGVLYCQGRLIGLGSALSIPSEGQYRLCRWNGDEARTATLSVGATLATLSPWTTDILPDPVAVFTRIALGRQVPPHRLVSWVELGWAARQASQTSVLEQVVRQGDPLLAVRGLSPAAVSIWNRWRLKKGCRLPNHEEAQRLSRDLGLTLWCQGSSGIDVVGDRKPDEAYLVAVPE